MYRVTHKRIIRNEDGEHAVYETGDTFDATESEVEAFGDRLEAVPETEEPTDPADVTAEPDLPVGLGDYNVDQLRDMISAGELDGYLGTVAEETERVTVERAAKERLD